MKECDTSTIRYALQNCRIELWNKLYLPMFSWIIRDIDKALDALDRVEKEYVIKNERG